MGVFRGVFNRLMQPVLGAMAELERLCSVTAVCVCLRLVHEEASNQEAGSTPGSISPLQNLVTSTQHIPSLQKCTARLRHWCIRAMRRHAVPCGPYCGPRGFFLVEDWNHAHNQLASRLSTHIVVKTAERHCKSGVQTHSLDETSKYNINMYISSVILNVGIFQYFFTDTYVYLLIYLQLSRQKYLHIVTRYFSIISLLCTMK
jgi:hypothetical protein